MSADVARSPSIDGGNHGSFTPPSGDEPPRHVCSKYLKKRPPDMYGQRHPLENPELINDSLELLVEELWKLPDEDQSGTQKASIRCPDIIESKEHRLMFLRCEQFNVDTAAVRMANYWKRRIELFGDAAFAPLTIEGSLNRDEKELSIGFLRLMPSNDKTGRSNIFLDPSVIEGRVYDNESMVRAAWYTLHTALEDESTQRKGIVFLVYLKYTYVRHFDRSLVSLLADSIRGVLPVRVSAIHIFHAPYIFEILFDVVSMLLGDRLTKRIKMYSEDDDIIRQRLSRFFIKSLPTELGGDVKLDQEKWISERKEEGK
mmetsp:Transcript_24335/g.48534  ORF Transcript_24335/g.48534 Transcript_24335/m.48534 type:complete len:315 (+) Transcript_24335:291-1235(+)